MAENASRKIYKICSRGGQIFYLDRKAMEMIEPVRVLFTAGGLDQVPLEEIIPIRLEISTAALQKVVQWCNHHKNDPDDLQLEGDEISEWDLQFLDIRYGLLFEILRSSRDYEIPALFELCCRFVGRNPHEIVRGFIEHDEDEIEVMQASAAA